MMPPVFTDRWLSAMECCKKAREISVELAEEKSAGWVVWLQSLQWMVFLLANVVAIPILVGAAFDLPAADISTFVQRMLVVTGVVLILISFLPIMTRIRDLFTPLVTGVYLVLLVV